MKSPRAIAAQGVGIGKVVSRIEALSPCFCRCHSELRPVRTKSPELATPLGENATRSNEPLVPLWPPAYVPTMS